MCPQDSLLWGAQPRAGEVLALLSSSWQSCPVQPGQAGEKPSSSRQRWRWGSDDVTTWQLSKCSTVEFVFEMWNWVLSERAENRNHFLGEPSSVKPLCIQGKYVILPPPVKCGKKGLKCAKLFEKKVLQASISEAYFRHLSCRKADKSWFCLLCYCVLVRCKMLLLSCCLLWIQPSEFPFSSLHGFKSRFSLLNYYYTSCYVVSEIFYLIKNFVLYDVA